MLKQDISSPDENAYELPKLAIGDVLLAGKFKNRAATITEINQPVAQTDKGEHMTFKSRIAKLTPARQGSKLKPR